MAEPRYGPDNPPPELLDDVRRRLAGVCAEWPEELFAAVTVRAAWITFKYDRAMTEGLMSPRFRDTAPRERSMSA